MTQSQDTGPPTSGSTRNPYLALVIVAIIIVVVGALIWGLLQSAGPSLEEKPPTPGVGKRFTGLELQPLTGDVPPLSSADVQGQVVLLNFWGPWCPPCRRELPHVAELAKRFADREDFRLAAISYPPGGQPGDVRLLREDTANLLDALGLRLPTYYDSDNVTLTAIEPIISFRGFPTTVLLDRQGMIRAVWVGYVPGTEDDIEQHIGKLLSEPAGEQK